MQKYTNKQSIVALFSFQSKIKYSTTLMYKDFIFNSDKKVTPDAF